MQSENKEQSQLLGSTVLVFFLFFLLLLTVDWTLFSAFSFLEREDRVLSQHWFGTVPKAQSVLHCHCVFKLLKIKTVLWGMKKSEMSWGHSGRLWDVHFVRPWSLANHQWGMKFCWQAYGWAYKQILPQLSLQITAVLAHTLIIASWETGSAPPSWAALGFLIYRNFEIINVHCFQPLSLG